MRNLSTLLKEKALRIFLFLSFALFSFFSASAQQRTITGKITDENNNPLRGVSVVVKGSTRGTTTNEAGNYSISASTGETLDFSIVGYNLMSVTVGSESEISQQLLPATGDIDEVVVVGYGTQKRSTLTGAVASVSPRTLNELPVPSIDQALQGRVSGLSITNNGSPGMAPIVQLRGVSSVNNSSEPLYVIDGFPTGNLGAFDAKDVESLEVLKDASAAAIYGSRATNGVIMITTKKGKRDGRVSVNLDTYIGVQSPAKKIDLLNTEQYIQYGRALLGTTTFNNIPRMQPANFNSPIYAGTTQTYSQTNTDWQDEYFVDNAVITQSNLSLSGGNNISRFYSSAGYFKQEGIAVGLGHERGNFRINSEHAISKRFTFGQNLYLAYSDQRVDGTGGNRSPLTNVVRMQPYLPVRDPTKMGGFRGPENSFDGSDPTNPVEFAILNETYNRTLKLLGTAYLDVSIMPWLRFRSTFGVDYANLLTTTYVPMFNDGGTGSQSFASLNNIRNQSTVLLYTQALTFDKTFDKHHVNVVGVWEQQGQKVREERQAGNLANNDVRTLSGATNISTSQTDASNLIQSWIARLTYDYDGKYLLNASVRRDGLSVFAPGHKFKNFPAVSAGWRLDRENFMSSLSSAISELKLRIGWGETGINGVLLGNYPYQVTVNALNSNYPFNNVIGNPNGSYYDRFANKELEWEVTKQTNFGIDLGLWRNKLTLSAEYYIRSTDNLIINIPIPPSYGLGNGGNVPTNAAAMRNKGFDLQIGYHKRDGAFKWDVNGIVSVTRNKVTRLNIETASFPGGADADFGNGPITMTVVGQPIQSFYGWVTDGIFQNPGEVSQGPIQVAGSTSPGDIRFKDISGPDGRPDGRITDHDRTFIGSYLPKFSYSLNYTANYKNFDLSLFFQGTQGNKVFNAERIIVEGMIRLFNSGTRVLDAWTVDNPDTDIPRAIGGDPNGNARVSSRWVEDGSYLRLKNMILGYNFTAGKLQSWTRGVVKNFRVFVSAQNLFTITKYKGWDPEVGNVNTKPNRFLTIGIDYGQYPSARSFQAGLQVGF